MMNHPTSTRRLMQPTNEGPKRTVRSVFNAPAPVNRYVKPKNRAEKRKAKFSASQRLEPWNY